MGDRVMRTDYFREYYHARKAKRTEAEQAEYNRVRRIKARVKRLGWTYEQAMRPVRKPLSPGYLSTHDLAKLAGCARDTVCSAIRRGELRAVKVKRTPKLVRWEIHREDAERWVTVVRA
jgi:excisionase family DNA binding protein